MPAGQDGDRCQKLDPDFGAHPDLAGRRALWKPSPTSIKGYRAHELSGDAVEHRFPN
jgi:hypothetical protein